MGSASADTPPRPVASWPALAPFLESGRPASPDSWDWSPTEFLRHHLEAAPTQLPDCVVLDSLYAPATPDSIDVLHYAIHVRDVDFTNRTLTGETRITIRALRPLSALDLHLEQLEPTAAGLDGAPLDWTRGEDALHFVLPDPVPAGAVFTVELGYAGAPSCEELLKSGLVFTVRGAHTFAEPIGARYWFPCHDVPRDKATVTLTVDHADGIKASATGVPLPVDAGEAVPAGRTRSRWEITDPVSTYLVAFYLGDFVEVDQAPVNGVPVQYYTYPDVAEITAVDVGRTPQILEFFSTIHPYPFARYAQTFGEFGGGMEHQTNSLIGTAILRGDRGFEWLIAHEAAHQWWGDLLTPAAWQHIWLNEGFATYFERLWTEEAYDAARALQELRQLGSVYFFGDSLVAARGRPTEPLLHQSPDRLLGFVVYNKGCWILHMLRGVLSFGDATGRLMGETEFAGLLASGRDRLFSVFGAYAAAHAYGNVTTPDFQEAAEEGAGRPLDWFFRPWLEERGHPEFAYDVNRDARDGYTRLTVRLSQTQADAPRFSMPLHVRYRSGSDIRHEIVAVGPDPVTWTRILPGEDWTAELDPDSWILAEWRPQFTPRPLGAITARPNPAASRVWFEVDLADAEQVTGELVILDARGREVVRSTVAVAPGAGFLGWTWDRTTHDGRRAPDGVYFARLDLAGTVVGTRIVLVPGAP